jgi:hypothetical protein
MLDCGARVDVHYPSMDGRSLVMLAVEWRCDLPLFRRLPAADPDCLAHCSTAGLLTLHTAALKNPRALPLLLGSGLPHLAQAVDKVALGSHQVRAPVTPLHCAIAAANWDAALALLAAGARVDIVGYIDGWLQTMAGWARGGLACLHRRVKTARAREHAAQAQVQVGAAAVDSASGSVPATANDARFPSLRLVRARTRASHARPVRPRALKHPATRPHTSEE